MTKFKDIKGLTQDELNKKLRDMREDLFDMKMKNTLGQVANPLKIRSVRRDVARLMTALSQKLAR